MIVFPQIIIVDTIAGLEPNESFFDGGIGVAARLMAFSTKF